MMQRSNGILLAIVLFVVTTGVNLHAPLYAAYASVDGYGTMATTTAFAAYVAGVMPVLLGLGGLSDRIGRRPVMALSVALSATGTLVMLAVPHLPALAAARFLLGVGTALMSSTAAAYMAELMGNRHSAAANSWVTASTSLGFGVGPALTSATLLLGKTLTPPSLLIHFALATLAAGIVWRLPETHRSRRPVHATTMLRLPLFTAETMWFGGAILLCWATTGVVISILPAVLARNNLAGYSGLSTMLSVSCGLLFQPLARRLPARRSTLVGLAILVPAYALLTWGATNGDLPAVAVGALAVSSACYGFVYLGGLNGATSGAAAEKARASAGFFLFAYTGFSVPVICTGLVADVYGQTTAIAALGAFITLGAVLLFCIRDLRQASVGA
jgi:MFS family permease